MQPKNIEHNPLYAISELAWENSRHLPTLQLVSPPNDVSEMSTETPYWWRLTTQMWFSASDWLNQI